MPHLILSDIHGNIEALSAVLEDARGRYERILCLGDLVGYGADPNAVVEWVRENTEVTIRGNHDKACWDPEPAESFNPVARVSAMWTRLALSPASLAYIERLPRGPLRYDGFDVVHGSPFDEDEYLITLEEAWMAREFLAAQVTFFGHTHVQGGFLLASSGVGGIDAGRTLEIEPDYFYLVNPGSVGQPRDRDPRAAYALYSPEERAIEFRRVAYDVDRAAAKILAAGLPEFLAARLFEGA